VALLDTLTTFAQLTPVEQNHLDQARQMQAMSFAVHIPLVAFGVGFPAMVVFVEWLGMRTGDPLYRRLARRWTRIMVALFAVGVITGTILSFEMGLLWPQFMSTFASVFGLGFAIEGFSFFLEAIFIGIYVYGWDRLSPKWHLASGFPIIATGFLGSMMVISVNSWMNHPGGFRLQGNRAVDVHPWKALFDNSFLWHEITHMYVAAYIVVGFCVSGAYAYGKLRHGAWGRYEKTALAIPLTIAAIAAPVQILVGDWAARTVAVHQPVKLAALEGLQRTTRGASEHILGWYESDGDIKYGIGIPKLLSFLSDHRLNATVRGLDSVPPRDRPRAINVERYAFQAMVGIGTLMALVGVFMLWIRWRKRRLPESVWFYRVLVLIAPASVVALIAGWVTTEVGRQPWVVYNIMYTDEAVTGAGGIPVGYGVLAAVYLAVIVGTFWVLNRLAKSPLGGVGDPMDLAGGGGPVGPASGSAIAGGGS
jgi:cytochrome d ubiquinol oxidase subunit I